MADVATDGNAIVFTRMRDIADEMEVSLSGLCSLMGTAIEGNAALDVSAMHVLLRECERLYDLSTELAGGIGHLHREGE